MATVGAHTLGNVTHKGMTPKGMCVPHSSQHSTTTKNAHAVDQNTKQNLLVNRSQQQVTHHNTHALLHE